MANLKPTFYNKSFLRPNIKTAVRCGIPYKRYHTIKYWCWDQRTCLTHHNNELERFFCNSPEIRNFSLQLNDVSTLCCFFHDLLSESCISHMFSELIAEANSSIHWSIHFLLISCSIIGNETALSGPTSPSKRSSKGAVAWKAIAEMNSRHYGEEKSCAVRHVLSNCIEVWRSQCWGDVMTWFCELYMGNRSQ